MPLSSDQERNVYQVLLRGRAARLRREAVRLARQYAALGVDDETASADTSAIIDAWRSAGPDTGAAPPDRRRRE